MRVVQFLFVLLPLWVYSQSGLTGAIACGTGDTTLGLQQNSPQFFSGVIVWSDAGAIKYSAL